MSILNNQLDELRDKSCLWISLGKWRGHGANKRPGATEEERRILARECAALMDEIGYRSITFVYTGVHILRRQQTENGEILVDGVRIEETRIIDREVQPITEDENVDTDQS